MIDWRDLRYVLAIARAGGLASAAQALGVNQSTVFRRLNALEATIGLKLFERLQSGYQPTPAGHRLLAAAERVEAEVMALDRDLTGRDARLSGHLRVTASETMAFRILTEQIAGFRQTHPGITVELVVDNEPLDLSRREADLALRATRPGQGDLFGRKLSDISWSVYGSDSYLTAHGVLTDVAGLAEHSVIGWGGRTARMIRTAQWLSATVPDSAVVYRSSSLINQMVAAKANVGLAVLPCYLADPEPDLQRLMPPIDALTRELWLITHNDLRQTARVRAFMQQVGNGIGAQRALLDGSARSI